MQVSSQALILSGALTFAVGFVPFANADEKNAPAKTDKKPDNQAKPENKGKPAAPAAEGGSSEVEDVPYPYGFRRWKHVKSMVIFSKKHSLFDAFGGMHHIYVNDLGYTALRKKTEFPNGAEFAFDLVELNESSGAYTEGKRKFVAIMHRDTEKYPETEGWGWQAFKGGSPRKPVLKSLSEQKACATCHKEVDAKQFVFSEWRK